MLTCRFFIRSMLPLAVLLITGAGVAHGQNAAKPPDVGGRAPDFSLEETGGKPLGLWALTARKPVVLVVLRGYPGYQCPLCNSQVAEFVTSAKELEAAGAEVVFVYPGPAGELKKHAEEFLGSQTLPSGFHLVLDPDYKTVALYGLRWDTTNETAYPATFVIDSQNTVRFRKVSQSHGDRTKPAELLKVLPQTREPGNGP